VSEPADVLLKHLPLIDRLVARLSMRYGMSRDEAEEFAAEAKYRLVDDDYAIIRKFMGRSSFSTYLTTVLHRLLHDYRIRERGKWHPSAEARRLGDAGMDLERLIHRDDWTRAEAINAVLLKHSELSRDGVEAMAARLPLREPRPSTVPIEHVHDVLAADSSDLELANSAAEVSKIVANCLAGLSEDDRLLLQLRFGCEMTVSQIARALQRDQQLLYRRMYALFESLRSELEKGGFGPEDIGSLIGSDAIELHFGLRDGRVSPLAAEDAHLPVVNRIARR